jgi:stage II sporulation protein D (peptidoglycan lytic transglycosylase)
MKNKFIFIFLIFIFCMASKPSLASDQWVKVHVLSLYHLHEVKIHAVDAKFKILRGKTEEFPWPENSEISLSVRGSQVVAKADSVVRQADQVWVESPQGGAIEVQGATGLERSFSGRLAIRVRQNELFFVEELPLEDYVLGVLASEMPQDFPLESLKAQAVLIRTYVQSHADRHAREGFQFCDLTHCQAYAGKPMGLANLEAAVAATRSLILTYRGQPIEALYHSSCGGHTSANQRVFAGKALPYLQSVSDGDYCSKSPQASWETWLSLEELQKALSSSVKDLRVADREPEGRVFALYLNGKTISTEEFLSMVGRSLGWNRIKSNWFEMEVLADRVHFVGHGLGHGVGLCQWGAKGMAEAGKGFEEILFHYFPGTRLVKK